MVIANDGLEGGRVAGVGAGALALMMAACGPSVSLTDTSGGSGSGTDTDSDDQGSGADETGEPDEPAPPPGLRMLVLRVTSEEYSYDAGPSYLGYPGRVDLVEFVDGVASSAVLIESIDCHWDGAIRCPEVDTSPLGWLTLAHSSGWDVGVEEVVWSFDATELLPAAPMLGRVIDRGQLAPIEGAVYAQVVEDWIAISRSPAATLEVTALEGDAPIEVLAAESNYPRPVAGTDTLIHHEGRLFATELGTGSVVQIDDPQNPADPGTNFKVASNGERMVFSQMNEAAGVLSVFEVPLWDGVPGPAQDLGSAFSSESTSVWLKIAPDGLAAWWQNHLVIEGQSVFRNEYVGLDGNAPTSAITLDTDEDAKWSGATGSVVIRVTGEDAFEFLDRTTLETTRVEPEILPGTHWTPCGPGILYAPAEELGMGQVLAWVDLAGQTTFFGRADPSWLCSPSEDYLAWVDDEEDVYVRRLTPEGLGDAEVVGQAPGEGYVPALETSVDGTILAWVECPEFSTSWPSRTCPGTLRALDMRTGQSDVLLDEHYILVDRLSALNLPLVAME